MAGQVPPGCGCVGGGRVGGGGWPWWVVGGGLRLAIDGLAASTGYAVGGKGTAWAKSNLTMRQQHDMTSGSSTSLRLSTT